MPKFISAFEGIANMAGLPAGSTSVTNDPNRPYCEFTR